MFKNHTFLAQPTIFLQVDENDGEDFTLTSDAEFKAIRSLILGRIPGQQNQQQKPREEAHSFNNAAEFFTTTVGLEIESKKMLHLKGSYLGTYPGRWLLCRKEECCLLQPIVTGTRQMPGQDLPGQCLASARLIKSSSVRVWCQLLGLVDTVFIQNLLVKI